MSLKFLPLRGKKGRHIGIEIEVEGVDWRSDCDRALVTDRLGAIVNRIVSDSSLEGKCMEIITQPMTKEYFRAKQYRFKELMRALKASGATAYDNNRCGLHVHISKELFEEQQAINVQNFIYTNKEIIRKLAQRSTEKFNNWSKPCYDTNRVSDAKFSAFSNKDSYGTYEIRVFRGTLEYSTFISHVELVFALIEHFATKNIQSLDFDTFFNETVKNSEYKKLEAYINRKIYS